MDKRPSKRQGLQTKTFENRGQTIRPILFRRTNKRRFDYKIHSVRRVGEHYLRVQKTRQNGIEAINTAPYLLKPSEAKHLGRITVNLTVAMVEHYSTKKNRSKQILKIVREYLNTLDYDDFKGDNSRKTISISKPDDALIDYIYLALNRGIAINRSELFREAIRWDMRRDTKEKQEQLAEDKVNGVVRVPNGKSETIYNVIGTA